MYLHREIEKKIQPFLRRKEVIALIGPRQVGKTTFLQFLEHDLMRKKKKVRYLTFEKRSDLNLFQESIEDFRSFIQEYDYAIIDEFQYAKNGGQNLKYLYDTTKVKFIISGSSSLELTFETGKYMVGRMIEFRLFPFSFREFISSQDQELFQVIKGRFPSSPFTFKVQKIFGPEILRRLITLSEQYLIYGGYPAVVLAKTPIEKQKILENIIDNYLLKDIRGLLHLATEDSLLKLATLLASQIGNIITYRELSLATGLPYKELLKHLEILEKTFLIHFVRPFFKNKRTELVKNPKVYFLDLGIRNFLLSDFRPFQARGDYGSIIENYVYLTLKHGEFLSGLKYWRTKSKAEVDFVIEWQQKIIPLEVKYSSRPTLGKSFYSFIDKFRPEKAFVFTKDLVKKEKIRGTMVQYLPVVYF